MEENSDVGVQNAPQFRDFLATKSTAKAIKTIQTMYCTLGSADIERFREVI